MTRKKKELPLWENVEITGVAAEGKAVARVGDYVVFVPFVVPGDVVDLQVRRKKHSYAEAEAVRFHHYAALREQPFCPHYGVCGGCKWQILPYDEQLRYKQQQVVDALTRIGHLDLPPVSPILGSERTREYRNKLEYTFADRRWLTAEEIGRGEAIDDHTLGAAGFHIPGAFDKVLNIEACHLQADITNRLRNAVRDYARQQAIPFQDLRTHQGVLRNLIVRTSTTGELMVILIGRAEHEAEREQLLDVVRMLADRFPEITSLLYVVNNKVNDTITDLPVHAFRGPGYIYERMEGLRFKIGPKSFYQTNSEQAYRLYTVVRQFAGLTGSELVYDLYTGTGTIANFVARQCRQVVGIEYVPEAIDDARVNAALNGIDNARFYAGDMKDLLTDSFIRENGRPDVIITDPPRAGMHPDVVRVVLRTQARRIVYVSCNPATQARDLQVLCQEGTYRIAAVQPVDMFPHTQHVENVVLLELTNDI